jgi:hypothetical protein
MPLGMITRQLALAVVVTATALLTGATASSADTSCDGWMMVVNGGFEAAPGGATPIPGWCMEGVDTRGVDRGLGIAYAGSNDAYIESYTPGHWNAITQHQWLEGQKFVARAWVRTSGNVVNAYFGVRMGGSPKVHMERRFGPLTNGWTLLEVPFSRGNLNDVTIFVGYWSPGGYSYLMVDEVSLVRA